MTAPKPPDPGTRENAHPLYPRGSWTATVTKVGRWSYLIRYSNTAKPLMESYDGERVFGSRVRADNRARRGINKRNREEQLPVVSWRVGDW